jgi:predicted RNA binding protein YcfA (HicA-like mRNA interferase family)
MLPLGCSRICWLFPARAVGFVPIAASAKEFMRRLKLGGSVQPQELPMPRLWPLSATEVGGLLRTRGFVFVHQRGSHLIYPRQLPGGDSATVPVPNRREIPMSALKSIIAVIGLEES